MVKCTVYGYSVHLYYILYLTRPEKSIELAAIKN